jgi:hypothetical protein
MALQSDTNKYYDTDIKIYNKCYASKYLTKRNNQPTNKTKQNTNNTHLINYLRDKYIIF